MRQLENAFWWSTAVWPRVWCCWDAQPSAFCLQECGNLSEAELQATRLLDYGPAAKERARALLRKVHHDGNLTCALASALASEAQPACLCKGSKQRRDDLNSTFHLDLISHAVQIHAKQQAAHHAAQARTAATSASGVRHTHAVVCVSRGHANIVQKAMSANESTRTNSMSVMLEQQRLQQQNGAGRGSGGSTHTPIAFPPYATPGAPGSTARTATNSVGSGSDIDADSGWSTE